MENHTHTPVIYLSSTGVADQFPYSKEKNKIGHDVSVMDVSTAKEIGLVTYDGRPFVVDNCYIEHPFRSGVYFLFNDSRTIERNIQNDRDEQIATFLGILGCRDYVCTQHTIHYKKNKVKAFLKGRFGLYKGKANSEYNREEEQHEEYQFSTSFPGTEPNIENAKKWLEDNNLSADTELNQLLDARNPELMGGNIIGWKQKKFDYSSRLIQTLDAAADISKVKVFKVDATFNQEFEERNENTIEIEMCFTTSCESCRNKDKCTIKKPKNK